MENTQQNPIDIVLVALSLQFGLIANPTAQEEWKSQTHSVNSWDTMGSWVDVPVTVALLL